ncbi:MAG: polysaccharide biosynthesis tyrosine autokinase, partial [Acidobacteriaceae bacterium]|nr:polysaccharide biosynthesis tyrosine autokinase [Acidobacteriaceae bacterium]
RMVVPHKRTVLLFTLVCTLLGFLLTRVQSPVYRAETLIEIESLNEDFLNMRNVSPVAPEGANQPPEYNIRTQIAVLQSTPVLERTLQKKNLEKRLLANAHRPTFLWSAHGAPAEQSREILHAQALSMADEGLRVRAEPNTPVVEVSFDSTDASLAADLANSLISAFAEVSLENRWRSIQSTSEWLTRQLQDVKTRLEQSEDALQRYAHASNLTPLSGAQSTTSEEHLKELQIELSKAEADRVETQSRYEQATKAPAESLPEVVDNPTLRDYQVQMTALRRQLADLSSSFTSSYPKVVSVRSQIEALQTALEQQRANVIARTRNEYEAALRRERLVRSDYEAVLALMAHETDKLSHYSDLKREVDTTRQLYDSMTQRVKEADLASAMKATDVHVIEAARAPESPYKPNTTVYMGLGLICGLCFGSVFIIQRARSNYASIQQPGETALELAVPELGVIPAAKSFGRLLGDSATVSRRDSEVAARKKAQSVLADSFRQTLASILLSSNDGIQPRVIAFSSACAREGKTTVTSNLGIALAAIDRRVLLVDGDLRRPRLHLIFDVDNTVGLNEALASDSTPSVTQSKFPNLFLLPSGRASDGDMFFNRSKLRELIDRLKAEFDMILIDTPPLLQVADSRLICSQADAAVLVVAQNTPREVALLARQRLADDGTHLLGTILNNWNPKANLHRYPNYSRYYSRHDAEQ